MKTCAVTKAESDVTFIVRVETMCAEMLIDRGTSLPALTRDHCQRGFKSKFRAYVCYQVLVSAPVDVFCQCPISQEWAEIAKRR